jgi:fructokinase
MAKMRSGDRLARLVWQRYVNRVARGLSLVVNTLDPDILVMGGLGVGTAH